MSVVLEGWGGERSAAASIGFGCGSGVEGSSKFGSINSVSLGVASSGWHCGSRGLLERMGCRGRVEEAAMARDGFPCSMAGSLLSLGVSRKLEMG